MTSGPLGIVCCAAALLCLPGAAFAQRDLHWESFEVDATLDATGTLRVAETQAMVFNGGWNGGERRFDIRPRQRLRLISLSRLYPGGWRDLTEDSSLSGVDQFAWTDRQTLRWRSRNTTDPLFANTTIRYLLRYDMTGILDKDDAGFVLNHDFLFAQREGDVNRFALRLTLDPAWQPATAVPEVYEAKRLEPGRGFVVTLPLTYIGAAVPIALDSSRPREVKVAAGILLLTLGLGLAAFFVREERQGRFAPLATNIDEAWLREHILKYPAEVVGAAWDEGISTPEVVALIARLVSEGKLTSTVNKGGSMSLTLEVDRGTLEGYERTLVDGLFFNRRTQTSTAKVRAHYKRSGFNPADTIRRELQTAVESTLPQGHARPRVGFLKWPLVVLAAGLLGYEIFFGFHPVPALVMGLGGLLLLGLAWGAGTGFRAHVHWGLRAAWACASPALIAFLAALYFLWFVAGSGVVEASLTLIGGVVTAATAVLLSSIDAMSSRQPREGVAFRRKLAAGREFFISELRKDKPALRDEWFPWLLAFGLGNHVDQWSTQRAGSGGSTRRASSSSTFTSSSSSFGSSSDSFGGFTGGRSGGAGGGAAWVSAASGMAASVSSPSSSDSGGGSSSSSSSSSGGGGGGGW